MWIQQYQKKWRYRGIAYEGDLENATTVFKKGDSLEYAGEKIKTTVCGVKFVDGSVPYVDDIQAEVKSYEFVLNGKEWGIEFWYVENITNENYTIEFI